ncbi:BICD family-like cargo adapter 2 isoform X2 [Dunckerocampus dactyliophorus]|uniref:BICD family-like cargo adapter 2 isoform X2 n=1 Tax=Dunckerocampus dactyliophorus TaxID=161453 RepID=UPI002404DEB7|nr:BICD family-like cargo adapter 2 isoform X2 [Dunckerocampus dactyliophorus]
MFTPKKNSLPSPSLEDSFFPLSSSSSISLSFALPTSTLANGSIDTGGGIETDLILAAELGQALLEKNEELAAALEEKEREVETLQQEKHVLQRRMEMNELASGQKEAELNGDLAALRAELERHQCLGRDRRRDESEQLTQLANHNQRLVEQLSEAVTLEHTLRTEIRTLRDEMDESSFSRNISSTQLENTQAENRILKERLTHMEAQLKASYEDNDRLRSERDVLRDRVSDLQVQLKEKEAEAKDALLAHSVVLQARDDEITALKEELKCQQEELDLLRKEIEPFRRNPGQPSYSSLENELATVRQEKDLLNQQLLNTIQHKVALSQELDAWQEDMRLVINQQVLQKEEDRIKQMQREQMSTGGLQRSKSLRLKGEAGKGFFSSLFRDK